MFPLDEAVRVSAQATYVSSRELPDDGGRLPDALVLDVGLSGQLGDSLRYFAGVTNLLNDTRPPVLGANVSPDAVAAYGRGFLIQVSGAY
jgi:hypothetical protein